MNSTNDQVCSQVQMPASFFAKSKLDYADWRWAYFRELIQNCRDAGASSIEFQMLQESASDNSITIRCVDDGCGMSRDTLENVLLCLGGSRKYEGAVGGFGIAKQLLFFAHARYTITTGNHVVHGAGGSYTISEIPAARRGGTYITVVMENESVATMSDVLRRYVSFLGLDVPVRISLNGEQIRSTFTDFEFKSATDIGTLLFKDVRSSISNLVVAVQGLPMFVHQVFSAGDDAFQGVLNIKGSSTDLLTSNRDALKGEYAAELNRLVRRMLEQRFAFKLGQTIDITLNYTNPVQPDIESRDIQFVSSSVARMAASSSSEVSDYENVEQCLRFMENDTFPHNFNLRIQNTVGRKTKQVAASTMSVSTVLQALRKGWVQRLAVSWKHIVYQLLQTDFLRCHGVSRSDSSNIEEYYFKDRRIAAGFIFANSLEGINIMPADSKEALILCNPLVFTKDFSVGDLCDLAIHETAHLLSAGHNDLFIDIDMKLRRSLRRSLPEPHLEAYVKLAVRQWRNSQAQL